MSFNTSLFSKKSIPGIILANLLRCSAYFLFLGIVVLLLYQNTPAKIFPYLFSDNSRQPNTYWIVLASSIIFVLFILVCGAVAAAKEQSHFQTSLGIRILLFVMNVMPIALFQHCLLPVFGFRIIFFFLVYFFLQISIDLCLKHLLLKLVANKNVCAGKIIHELILVVLSVLIAQITSPSEYHTFNMRDMEFTEVIQAVAYLIYIVFFNAVTFFMVENCINIFRQEYNKNYIRFYFLYNYNPVLRIIQVLRNSLPEILQKFRKNLTWLVMFVIAVDSIFENINSIGFNLLDGYNYGSVIIIKNIFYILAIMFVINIVLDCLEYRLKSPHSYEKDMERTEAAEIGFKLKVKIFFAGRQKKFVLAGLFICLGLFPLCLVLYPVAGYYDFEVNQSKTLADFLNYYRIPGKNCSFSLQEYDNEPLCDAGKNAFSLIRLEVKQGNKIFKIIPFYDRADRTFYFIRGLTNRQKIENLSATDTILAVSKMKYPRLPGGMTAFRLPADTSSSISIKKPVWLAAIFCLFYFAALLMIVSVVTDLFYFAKKNSKLVSELVAFLNTSTLILVFLLVNLSIRNIDVSWENNSFFWNAIAYIFVQFVIILMFSDNYMPEIVLFKNRVFSSFEFKYYRLIGMSEYEIFKIFHKKYGINMSNDIRFQNILFVFNLNWFIVYAFNVWKNFHDSIGLTYAVSFENVLTKIIHDMGSKINLISVLLLIIINGALFYMYNNAKNKIYKRISVL